jgi:hypothetical protein
MVTTLHTSEKRPMGHIVVRNLDPYRNISPIQNMHFISFCPILPWGPLILTNLPSFCVRKLSCKIQLFWTAEFLRRRFLNDP